MSLQPVQSSLESKPMVAGGGEKARTRPREEEAPRRTGTAQAVGTGWDCEAPGVLPLPECWWQVHFQSTFLISNSCIHLFRRCWQPWHARPSAQRPRDWICWRSQHTCSTRFNNIQVLCRGLWRQQHNAQDARATRNKRLPH